MPRRWLVETGATGAEKERAMREGVRKEEIRRPKPVESPVTIEVDDGIAWVSLDDGKVNALSTPRLHEIQTALDQAERADAVVVLRGREGIFQRGLDATIEMLRAGAQLVLRLLAFPRPVLVVCTGHAYPAGAFLMLAADVRIGLAGDYRIGLNETAIGITVPRFAIELTRHRLTPAGFALLPSASMFGPEEARSLGYLDRVCAGNRLEAEVRAEAERLRSLDRASFVATKSRVHERAIAAIAEAVEDELRVDSGASTL